MPPLTLAILYRDLCQTLSESDSLYVIQKHTAFSGADLITRPKSEIPAHIGTEIRGIIERYQAGEPLSRLYNEREFWGLNFELSSQTLDPRMDTEILIEAVLAHYKDQPPPQRILDLGTGSGCILIALLTEFPQAQGIGTDLSAQALRTAGKNARTHKLDSCASFAQGSWGEALKGQEHGAFDLVVSNPPYISKPALKTLDQNVLEFDPILALDGGEDGLQAYKEIFSQLPHLLKKASSAFFEIGFDQKETSTRLGEESGFLVKGVYPDSAGHPRVIELCSE